MILPLFYQSQPTWKANIQTFDFIFAIITIDIGLSAILKNNISQRYQMMKTFPYYLTLCLFFFSTISCTPGKEVSEETPVINNENSLTMSGPDTATIGTSFPVTSARNEDTNIIIEASSCAIQPEDVCAFLGTLTLSFDSNGQFYSASLIWGQNDTSSFIYSVNCFPQACGSNAGINFDASAQTISFDNVEFATGMLGVSNGMDATAPITLDGTITLNNITFPSPAITDPQPPASSNTGSLTITGPDMDSQPFTFNGEFSPEVIRISDDKLSILWSDNTVFSNLGYHISLSYTDFTSAGLGKYLVFTLIDSQNSSSSIYKYSSDCSSAPSPCDAISQNTAEQTMSFNNVELPVSTTEGPVQNTLATSPITISGQLSIDPDNY